MRWGSMMPWSIVPESSWRRFRSAPRACPIFDGEIGSILTVTDDPRYSQPYADALSVAAWIWPLALENSNTGGSTDQYVHFLEKAVDSSTEVEWAMRFYNQTNEMDWRCYARSAACLRSKTRCLRGA